MAGSTQDVLSGEYESGLSGERLTVADIGANVGAFAIWALARWPGSRVTAYEPNPGTFEILQRNVAAFDGITAVNAAIYPTTEPSVRFFARYDGDGEAGVLECSEETFESVPEKHRLNVPALHPKDVSGADVVKIDAEGSEAEILRHLDLSSTSLVLLEFQNDSNRQAIKELLEPGFDLILEEEFPWDPLLGAEYRSSLAGDHYGHLFCASKRGCKLRRPAGGRPSVPTWRTIGSEIVRKLRRR